jgi:hypothetical protein
VRSRIGQLRKDLTETTAAYRNAKAAGEHAAVILLLRKRTELVRHLFQVQSELLLVLRSDTAGSDLSQAEGPRNEENPGVPPIRI